MIPFHFDRLNESEVKKKSKQNHGKGNAKISACLLNMQANEANKQQLSLPPSTIDSVLIHKNAMCIICEPVTKSVHLFRFVSFVCALCVCVFVIFVIVIRHYCALLDLFCVRLSLTVTAFVYCIIFCTAVDNNSLLFIGHVCVRSRTFAFFAHLWFVLGRYTEFHTLWIMFWRRRKREYFVHMLDVGIFLQSIACTQPVHTYMCIHSDVSLCANDHRQLLLFSPFLYASRSPPLSIQYRFEKLHKKTYGNTAKKRTTRLKKSRKSVQDKNGEQQQITIQQHNNVRNKLISLLQRWNNFSG